MNRKAKRNKYKNETAVLNFEIKSLRCERDKYIDYWRTANCKNAKLSLDLDKSEEEKNKYKDKYYEQLKKEFLDGTKELLTVSVNYTPLFRVVCSSQQKNAENLQFVK